MYIIQWRIITCHVKPTVLYIMLLVTNTWGHMLWRGCRGGSGWEERGDGGEAASSGPLQAARAPLGTRYVKAKGKKKTKRDDVLHCDDDCPPYSDTKLIATGKPALPAWRAFVVDDVAGQSTTAQCHVHCQDPRCVEQGHALPDCFARSRVVSLIPSLIERMGGEEVVRVMALGSESAESD